MISAFASSNLSFRFTPFGSFNWDALELEGPAPAAARRPSELLLLPEVVSLSLSTCKEKEAELASDGLLMDSDTEEEAESDEKDDEDEDEDEGEGSART